MTLEELIQKYQVEEYNFFKFFDKNGNEINIHFVFDTHRDYLDKYLSFYKDLPNMTEVIVNATDGIFKLTNEGITYFIRHNHQEVFIDRKGSQRGVDYEIARQVRDKLIVRFNEILTARDFDDIFKIVSESKVVGFGKLAIYDTSLRIASFLNLEPDRVYLHAGASAGMEILEIKRYMPAGSSSKLSLEVIELPVELQRLSAMEIEHFLCSMKDDLKLLDIRLLEG